MEATFRISEKDYVNAGKLFSRFSSKNILVLVIVFLVLIGVAIFASPILKSAAIGGLIGGFIVVFFGRLIFQPNLAKRHYRKYKAMQDEFSIQLLENGVQLKSPTSEGMVIWDMVLKWRQDQDYILIYLMPRLYYIVPKSISANGFDIQLLIEKLKINVGEEI